MKKKHLVSIIVTTKNEEKNIKNCLLSIIEQTYKNFEIIVVDNGSIDRTKEIARQYTKSVFEKGPERSAQRNYGMIDVAKGKYVMFVDADMILSQCIVEACVVYMEQSRCLALHIPEVILGNSYWSRVRRLERSFYNGTVVDGARFFDKESFVKVGGFDEGMSGPEDWDIDMKIKQIGSIGLIDQNVNPKCANKTWIMKSFIEERGINAQKAMNVIYHNESEFEIKNYLIKKGYYAKSFNSYIEKWGRDNPCIRKQFGLWYRFFGVFLENGKWKLLFANMHISIGIYLLRMLVGVTFIIRKFK